MLTVHPVRDTDLEAAYQLLRDVAADIARAGRRQRIANTTMETYRRWQELGGNYEIRHRDERAGVFSLVVEPLNDWPMIDVDGDVTWLRALATHPSHRHQGVGECGVEAAVERTNMDVLYLDCIAEFLPDYYGRLGFERVADQTLDCPVHGALDVTLMRRRVGE